MWLGEKYFLLKKNKTGSLPIKHITSPLTLNVKTLLLTNTGLFKIMMGIIWIKMTSSCISNL